MQGHSHQVWSGQVCSACVGMLQLGWGGGAEGMLPQKFLEFRGYEIASETILGQTMLLGGLMTEFHMHEYLPFLPIVLYSTGFGFPIAH